MHVDQGLVVDDVEAMCGDRVQCGNDLSGVGFVPVGRQRGKVEVQVVVTEGGVEVEVAHIPVFRKSA